MDSFQSARACFVRHVFDLPRSASHELAVILFDCVPVEILFMQRFRTFLTSIRSHDFVYVRDALVLDRANSSSPISFFANVVRLIKRFEPRFSAAADDVSDAVDRILAGSRSPRFVFRFLKFGDSDSMSFFEFESLDVLLSFRAFLPKRL